MFSLLADKLAASPSLLFVEPSVLVESTIFFLAILEHFTWIMAQWFVSLDLQWDSWRFKKLDSVSEVWISFHIFHFEKIEYFKGFSLSLSTKFWFFGKKYVLKLELAMVLQPRFLFSQFCQCSYRDNHHSQESKLVVFAPYMLGKP